jgi:hypothetical protein
MRIGVAAPSTAKAGSFTLTAPTLEVQAGRALADGT